MEDVEVIAVTDDFKRDTWGQRRVLVTGATGMVGSWVCRELVARNAFVVALVADSDPNSELIRSGVINQVTVVNGRLEHYDDVERSINNHEIDTVIHLGAQPIVGAADRAPRHTFESNIQGTWNVLDACRVLSPLVKRIVVASSDKAYGTQPVLPYTEDMSLSGDHPYEVSKSCTDLIAKTYARTYGLPVTIARCGNIYGGGDLNWNRIVPGMFKAFIRNEVPVLRSDGTFIRDYLHVDDIVNAYLTLADRSDDPNLAGEAFNFSDESPITVMQIFEEMRVVAGKPDAEPKILNTAQAEIKDQYLDATKAREILGWEALLSLKDGLMKTYKWYLEFLEGDES